MGKAKKKDKFLEDIEKEVIHEVEVGELCKDYMRVFAMNINIMRHIPEVFDGLKPGERRLLYTMYSHLKIRHDTNCKKCATIIGNTLAIHPHGDVPVYHTLAKLAQPWKTNMPLIDGQGNFGSIYGKGPAAMRYTEARLTEFAYKAFFEEFDLNILDTRLDASGEGVEPEYLPAKYPIALINGAKGIGTGSVSTIMPHNITEVLESVIKLIDNPDEDIFLVPDLPTGCDIVDNGELGDINYKGEGKLLMKAKIIRPGEHILSIQALPWSVSLVKIQENLNKQIKEGKLVGIDDYANVGEQGILDYRIILKKEIDPLRFLDKLYRMTQLTNTEPVRFKLIYDFEEISLNNKSYILLWLDRRIEIKRRIINHKIVTLREREHILKTLTFILSSDNAETTIKIVKNSENSSEIVEKLMNKYNISSLQAKNIANMQVARFSKESRRRYQEELEKVTREIEKYEKISKSPKKILKIIRDEMEEGIKLFGRPRRSTIIQPSGAVQVSNTKHVIVVTENGYIKKLSEDVDNIGYIQPGDTPVDTLICNNLDELLIFDRHGKISRVPVHEIEGTSLDSKGALISRYINSSSTVTRILIKPTEEFLENISEGNEVYVVMITERGIIKKTNIRQYMSIKNEISGISLNDNDYLQTIKIIIGDKDIIVYTNSGIGVRFNTSEIKETGRLTKGVKAIDLKSDEIVNGIEVVSPKRDSIFVLTDKGNGKTCTLDTLTTMSRNAKPLKLIGLGLEESLIFVGGINKGICQKFDIFMKNGLETIDSIDVPELTRMSKGRKIVPVRKGDMIIKIKKSITK